MKRFRRHPRSAVAERFRGPERNIALARLSVLAACLCLMPSAAGGLSLADIETWAGQGTNRAALVIDWRDGLAPQSMVWGYRWDGTATAADMIRAIAGAGVFKEAYGTNVVDTLSGIDPRLFAVISAQGSSETVFGLGYDLDADGSSFSYGWEEPGRETGAADDAGDHYAEGWFEGNWSHWVEKGKKGGFDRMPSGGEFTPTANPRGEWEYSGSSISLRPLEDGSWDGWKFIGVPYAPGDPDKLAAWEAARVPPGHPGIAVHHPYAVEVVAFDGPVSAPVDMITGEPFTNVVAALGRPTVDTTGDDTLIPSSENVPVTPVYPAFRAHELVTIGRNATNGNGRLDLRFDHRVLDHPSNPYGVDLIVFGNAFQLTPEGQPWTNRDPESQGLTALTQAELGIVSVSQDGVGWHRVPPEQGGADGFPPTLGRVFDPGDPDPGIGEWNLWWGAPTDPTFPLDPALYPETFAQFTLAEICRRYRGSAGGTGIDIGQFPLPPDETTGLKWIRYVRIERGEGFPEVDAIADVAPATPWTLWRIAHFAWETDPDLERPEADPDGDGIVNLWEYLFGTDPNAPDPRAPIRIARGGGAEPSVAITFPWNTEAVDIDHRVERAPAPGGPWTTAGIVQNAEVGAAVDGIAEVTATADAGEEGLVLFRIRAVMPDPHPAVAP